MYITRQDELRHTPTDNPIFLGDVGVQTLVDASRAESLRVLSVTFRDGASNKWHSHPTEQMLFVTSG